MGIYFGRNREFFTAAATRLQKNVCTYLRMMTRNEHYSSKKIMKVTQKKEIIMCKTHMLLLILCSTLNLFVNAAKGNDHLVAHWTFDQGVGDVAPYSISGSPGEIVGAQWASGSLYFDGVGDYVRVPITGDLALAADLVTIEAVINIASEGGLDAQHYVVDSRDGLGGGYCLSVDTETIQFGIGHVLMDFPCWGIEANQWHYVAGIYDGYEMRAYLDGEEVGSYDFAGDTAGTDWLYIGQNYTGDEGFHGRIDDIKLYTTVPEPATLVLLGLGGPALLRLRKRRGIA